LPKGVREEKEKSLAARRLAKGDAAREEKRASGPNSPSKEGDHVTEGNGSEDKGIYRNKREGKNLSGGVGHNSSRSDDKSCNQNASQLGKVRGREKAGESAPLRKRMRDIICGPRYLGESGT